MKTLAQEFKEFQGWFDSRLQLNRDDQKFCDKLWQQRKALRRSWCEMSGITLTQEQELLG